MANILSHMHAEHPGSLCWFGKLPCVGDFCSHNLSIGLSDTLDHALSGTMQLAEQHHAQDWERMYFNAPVHGFSWNQTTARDKSPYPCILLGVVMPSVDRAGRAFPFVLAEQFELTSLTQAPCFTRTWMTQALQIVSSALDEEWPLTQLQACRIQTNQGTEQHHDKPNWPGRGMCHWYRLDQPRHFDFSPVLTTDGFASPRALLSLWNLEST